MLFGLSIITVDGSSNNDWLSRQPKTTSDFSRSDALKHKWPTFSTKRNFTTKSPLVDHLRSRHIITKTKSTMKIQSTQELPSVASRVQEYCANDYGYRRSTSSQTVVQQYNIARPPLGALPNKGSYHPEDTSEHTCTSLSDNVFSRRVRFAVSLKKHSVIGLHEYTDAEKRKCWYSSEQKCKNKNRRERIIERMEAGKPPKSALMTYRGLEDSTKHGYEKLVRRIIQCIDAVMDEQEVQWRAFHDDFDRIAAVSQQVTASSIRDALDRALEDRREVEEGKVEHDSPLPTTRPRTMRTSSSKKAGRMMTPPPLSPNSIVSEQSDGDEEEEGGADTKWQSHVSPVRANRFLVDPPRMALRRVSVLPPDALD